MACARPWIPLSTAALAACNSLSETRDGPAVIASATPEARAEILAALEAALGDRDIVLAEDALTRSSALTLESRAGALTGRDRGTPERFDLVVAGGRCYLVHARTLERFALEQADCVPAGP